MVGRRRRPFQVFTVWWLWLRIPWPRLQFLGDQVFNFGSCQADPATADPGRPQDGIALARLE
eukprot:748375-Alexandrium_andersonii.AAC.1